jgi:peptidoglycan/xylan/chitin deacetylase (PgdA/CDA1 family)
MIIINYHQIYSDTIEEIRISGKFGTGIEDFKKQLNFLIKHSSLSNQLLLTFDDGFKSHFTEVKPLLLKHRLKGLFFPIPDKIGTEGYMTWEDLQDLSLSGFVIGAHGKSHQDLTKLDYQTLKQEIYDSKNILSSKLNIPIVDFSLPYGNYNHRTLIALKEAGFERVYTTLGIKNNPESSLMHRWNVKEKTTIRQLNKMIQNTGYKSLLCKFRSQFFPKTF